jgi:outer membrane protein TolC
MSKHPVIVLLGFVFSGVCANAQQKQDSLLTDASLDQCVQYAMEHLPAINQSLIDEKIADAEIKTRLADWYPQLNLDYSLQHYFQTPVTVINGTPTATAQQNFSTAYFSVKQNIFDRNVLLASKTAANVRTQVKQFTTDNKIYVALNVSKAFYSVLLSRQQIDLVDQDIVRLQRSLKDAENQYKAGIVDKTDYQRAQISLNNAVAEKKQYQETLQSRFSVLKLLMGYPQADSFHLVYDSVQLKNEIFFDTAQEVNFSNRIEYKILETQKNLLQSNLNYYKWSFIPSISAFGNYNLTYANNDFGKLYSREFPSSYIGLSLNFPIFQGGKRTWQIRSAHLQLDRLAYNFTSLRDSIQSEYTQALSTYKSYLSDYYTQQENLDLATDVYKTINLQYKAGVKAYLEVIVAESDLRTTQINYLNALYNVLSSKLDVERALGTLQY